MIQAKTQTVAEKEVIKEYARLKNLVRTKQRSAAMRLFQERGMIDRWRELLHYAMTRRNCPVTTIIIDMVYKHGDMADKVFEVEVSKLLHDITFEFAKRVCKYIAEGRFEEEHSKIRKVGVTVDSRMRYATGNPVTNLKEKHFDNSYLLEKK